MIIASFANTKGGVGKSTMAALIVDALIRKGSSVRVVDLDPQGTFSRWIAKITETTPTLTVNEPQLDQTADFRELYNELHDLTEEETDWVIIDTAGQDHFRQHSALAISDVVICPSGPIESELIGVQKTLAYLKIALEQIDPSLDAMASLRILYQKPNGFPDRQMLAMREVLFEHFGVIGEFHQSSAISSFLSHGMLSNQCVAALKAEKKDPAALIKIQNAADTFITSLEDQFNA